MTRLALRTRPLPSPLPWPARPPHSHSLVRVPGRASARSGALEPGRCTSPAHSALLLVVQVHMAPRTRQATRQIVRELLSLVFFVGDTSKVIQESLPLSNLLVLRRCCTEALAVFQYKEARALLEQYGLRGWSSLVSTGNVASLVARTTWPDLQLRTATWPF